MWTRRPITLPSHRSRPLALPVQPPALQLPGWSRWLLVSPLPPSVNLRPRALLRLPLLPRGRERATAESSARSRRVLRPLLAGAMLVVRKARRSGATARTPTCTRRPRLSSLARTLARAQRLPAFAPPLLVGVIPPLHPQHSLRTGTWNPPPLPPPLLALRCRSSCPPRRRRRATGSRAARRKLGRRACPLPRGEAPRQPLLDGCE